MRVAGGDASFGLNGVVNVGGKQRRKFLEVGKRQVLKVNAALNAMMNEFAGDCVRLTERQIFLDEIIRQIRGVAEIFFDGASHVRAINLHARDNLREDRQRKFHGIERVENAFLVLLQVFVVSKRQRLDRRQKCRQMTEDSAGLAAHQFGHVGIFFLRHHA